MAAMTMGEMKAHLIAKADENADFRTRLVADPKSVILDEFGISVPEDFNVEVHEDGSNTVHLVLPSAPLSEEELALIAAGQGDDYKEDPFANYPVNR